MGKDPNDQDPNDQFENLFEPFDLEGQPPSAQYPGAQDGTQESVPTGQQAASYPPQNGSSVFCGSCGSPNDPQNRHCEQCGARLQRSLTPVAPQPMLRTTAGARSLIVLSAIVLGVAILALVINVFGGGGDETAVTSTSTATTLATVPIGELNPIRTDCTNELDGFPCSALTDADPENSWNATDGGIGTELTFFFSPPVQITEVFLINIEDEERFTRNARIRGMEIVIDDLTQETIIEIDDTNTEPQRVDIRSLGTSSLTITITSAYPGASFDGKEPFPELALQEIQFFGRTTPETSGSSTTTTAP